MLASDGALYVVKFAGNPQGTRVLVNEWVGARLARRIGLPVPAVCAIDVPENVVSASSDLQFELENGNRPCPAGLHCGIRYVSEPGVSHVVDLLPKTMWQLVRNPEVFAGATVLDLWLGNADYRQFAFRSETTGDYTAFMIDQGDCFNRNDWNFPDLARQAGRREVEYGSAFTARKAERWVRKVERVSPEDIRSAAEGIPRCWLGNQTSEFDSLLAAISDRTQLIRQLVTRRAEHEQVSGANRVAHSSPVLA